MAAQDVPENAIAELGLNKMRFKAPVSHSDTLYAYTQVLAKEDAGRDAAGIVRFKHWGLNQETRMARSSSRVNAGAREAPRAGGGDMMERTGPLTDLRVVRLTLHIRSGPVAST